MDIFTLIQQERAAIAELMDAVSLTRKPERREAQFLQLKQALELHLACAQDILYASVQDHADAILLAEQDISELSVYLNRLTRIPVESDKWLEVFADFRRGVEQHARHEDSWVFPRARAQFSQAEADKLGEDMRQVRRMHGQEAAA